VKPLQGSPKMINKLDCLSWRLGYRCNCNNAEFIMVHQHLVMVTTHRCRITCTPTHVPPPKHTPALLFLLPKGKLYSSNFRCISRSACEAELVTKFRDAN